MAQFFLLPGLQRVTCGVSSEVCVRLVYSILFLGEPFFCFNEEKAGIFFAATKKFWILAEIKYVSRYGLGGSDKNILQRIAITIENKTQLEIALNHPYINFHSFYHVFDGTDDRLS
jgi:hypothetical protein